MGEFNFFPFINMEPVKTNSLMMFGSKNWFMVPSTLISVPFAFGAGMPATVQLPSPF
jgi:hypothetical protein